MLPWQSASRPPPPPPPSVTGRYATSSCNRPSAAHGIAGPIPSHNGRPATFAGEHASTVWGTVQSSIRRRLLHAPPTSSMILVPASAHPHLHRLSPHRPLPSSPAVAASSLASRRAKATRRPARWPKPPCTIPSVPSWRPRWMAWTGQTDRQTDSPAAPVLVPNLAQTARMRDLRAHLTQPPNPSVMYVMPLCSMAASLPPTSVQQASKQPSSIIAAPPPPLDPLGIRFLSWLCGLAWVPSLGTGPRLLARPITLQSCGRPGAPEFRLQAPALLHTFLRYRPALLQVLYFPSSSPSTSAPGVNAPPPPVPLKPPRPLLYLCAKSVPSPRRLRLTHFVSLT